MTKRAHIRNGEIIARFNSERGWINLEDGNRASPVVIGYASGNDKVVPIVEETVDNSTTEHTASERTETVERDRVLVTTTITDAPESIPGRVSSRQFKMQLHYAGLLDAVDTWIASQSKPVQLAYHNSGTFVRDDPMMEQGFAALGYTTKQIDDFFLAASKL